MLNTKKTLKVCKFYSHLYEEESQALKIKVTTMAQSHVRADRITFTLRKNEGYMSSGLGGRSLPVHRQAGWLAGRLAAWQAGWRAGGRAGRQMKISLCNKIV